MFHRAQRKLLVHTRTREAPRSRHEAPRVVLYVPREAPRGRREAPRVVFMHPAKHPVVDAKHPGKHPVVDAKHPGKHPVVDAKHPVWCCMPGMLPRGDNHGGAMAHRHFQ
jgi:hypothetical protein